jgi:hypothetical protein
VSTLGSLEKKLEQKLIIVWGNERERERERGVLVYFVRKKVSWEDYFVIIFVVHCCFHHFCTLLCC